MRHVSIPVTGRAFASPCNGCRPSGDSRSELASRVLKFGHCDAVSRSTGECDELNKDQAKSVAEKGKGKVNEGVGKVTGNPARELKGDLQQEAGQTRKDVGDIEEAAKDSAKRHP